MTQKFSGHSAFMGVAILLLSLSITAINPFGPIRAFIGPAVRDSFQGEKSWCSVGYLRGGGDDEGQERDLGSLKDWAVSNGVFLSEDIQLKQDPQTDSWGVVSKLVANLESDEKIIQLYTPKPNGDVLQRAGRFKVPEDGDFDIHDKDFGVLMRIPPELVMSSSMLDSPVQQRIKESIKLCGEGLEYFCPNFAMTLVFLEERSKGKASLWYPYFQSLPSKLKNGLYWDDAERDYAMKLGMRSMLETIDQLWEAFQNTLNMVDPHFYDPQLVKWAFSICYSRSWKAAYTSSTGERVSNLVCFGDLFNHRADFNVIVEQESAESPVTMVQTEPCDDDCDGLYLNYGGFDNPVRFPVIYGFCDTSGLTLPATTIMNSFKTSSALYEAAKIFGFVDDLSTMVFYTNDGAVSDRVWNAVLYRILLDKLHHAQSADEKKHITDGLDILYKACRKKPHGPMIDSDDALEALHQTHHQDMVESLLFEVDEVLIALGPLPAKMDEKLHPNWNMLREFHQHLLSTYLQVRNHLLDIKTS